MRKIRFLVFLCILSSEFSNSIQAEEWWEKKPYSQWTIQEVYSILYISPWSKDGIAGTYRVPGVVYRTIPTPVPMEDNRAIVNEGLPSGANRRIW